MLSTISLSNKREIVQGDKIKQDVKILIAVDKNNINNTHNDKIISDKTINNKTINDKDIENTDSNITCSQKEIAKTITKKHEDSLITTIITKNLNKTALTTTTTTTTTKSTTKATTTTTAATAATTILPRTAKIEKPPAKTLSKSIISSIVTSKPYSQINTKMSTSNNSKLNHTLDTIIPSGSKPKIKSESPSNNNRNNTNSSSCKDNSEFIIDLCNDNPNNATPSTSDIKPKIKKASSKEHPDIGTPRSSDVKPKIKKGLSNTGKKRKKHKKHTKKKSKISLFENEILNYGGALPVEDFSLISYREATKNDETANNPKKRKKISAVTKSKKEGDIDGDISSNDEDSDGDGGINPSIFDLHFNGTPNRQSRAKRFCKSSAANSGLRNISEAEDSDSEEPEAVDEKEVERKRTLAGLEQGLLDVISMPNDPLSQEDISRAINRSKFKPTIKNNANLFIEEEKEEVNNELFSCTIKFGEKTLKYKFKMYSVFARVFDDLVKKLPLKDKHIMLKCKNKPSILIDRTCTPYECGLSPNSNLLLDIVMVEKEDIQEAEIDSFEEINKTDDKDDVSDDDKEDDSFSKNLLKVVFRLGEAKTNVSLHPDQTFEKAFNHFAKELGVSVDKVVMTFDGEKISNTTTPEDLDLEEEDLIDVMSK